MFLKRIFDKSAPKGTKLDHIKVQRAGPKQHFSTRIVERGATEGWLTLGGGSIKLDTKPPLSYKIVRAPGLYCCHCAAKQGSSDEARVHIAKDHAGVPSPDKSNPAGYEHIHFYDCVKE
jgi:hypothetical protein